MPNLRDTGERFFSTFQIDGGQRIRASIWAVPDTTRVTNFNSARRVLRCKPGTPMQAGQVIHSPTGQTWIVANYGDSYQGGVVFRAFKLYEADRKGPLEREGRVKDPVTGLERPGVTDEIAEIYYTLEPAGSEEDKVQIPEAEYELITNVPLQLSDRVDGYKVLRVDMQLGIYIAHVRR